MTDIPGSIIDELDPAADPQPEAGDHPDDLTPEEVEDGRVMFLEVDDTDDNSNGLA